MTARSWSAARAAGLYALASALYIVVSDLLARAWFSDPQIYAHVQTIKGVGFVVASALVMYLLLSRELRRRHVEEDRFRALSERVSSTITVLGPDGQIIYTSPSIERITGYSVEERLGQSVFDVVDPEDAEVARTALAAVRTERGAIQELDLRMRRKDGEVRLMAVTAQNLLDDPAVRGIVLHAADVTERRSLAAQLRQAQKMEAVGRLAAGVAHDFNNLLTVITGWAHMALEGRRAEKSELEEVLRTCDRAADLSRRLMAFSRGYPIARETLDLNVVIRDTEALLRRLLPAGIQLVTRLQPDLPPVEANRGALEQVLVNLAVNAEDAMAGVGALTIETSVRDLNDDYARTHADVQPGRHVVVAVSDTGTGMTAEVQERIFEPFFTTKPEGTGLGLATLYGIVRQSGGHVRVDSEPGAGTTFRVFLPVSTEDMSGVAAPGEAAATDVEPAEPEGVTVLVVDDEAGVRALVARVLRLQGYRVLEARNGAEALTRARESGLPPDLVALDINLPDVSGRDLARRLREQHGVKRFLFMSGLLESTDADESGSAGAFLEKPFTPTQLAAVVKECLSS
ncbi:MAG: PAS domain S-box protein [Gemmatimonadota bacterium]|jgi:two-component system cell cycle sensor histidine kinase/response regulator CckA